MAVVSTATSGRIGPNAVSQTYEALVAALGTARADALLRQATGRLAATLPERMVDEREVAALVHGVMTALGPLAHAVLRDAGHRTARYLLAHRIPKPAQLLIRAVPPRTGLALLLAAISRHAWTFAGSGDVAWRMDAVPWVRIIRCPMCRDRHGTAPGCDFYAGTFEGLLRALIHPTAVVHESECEAAGAAACRFDLHWGRPLAGAPALVPG